MKGSAISDVFVSLYVLGKENFEEDPNSFWKNFLIKF
jgi:hypothetical protein